MTWKHEISDYYKLENGFLLCGSSDWEHGILRWEYVIDENYKIVSINEVESNGGYRYQVLAPTISEMEEWFKKQRLRLLTNQAYNSDEIYDKVGNVYWLYKDHYKFPSTDEIKEKDEQHRIELEQKKIENRKAIYEKVTTMSEEEFIEYMDGSSEEKYALAQFKHYAISSVPKLGGK